jgi:hypothetical protein
VIFPVARFIKNGIITPNEPIVSLWVSELPVSVDIDEMEITWAVLSGLILTYVDFLLKRLIDERPIVFLLLGGGT